MLLVFYTKFNHLCVCCAQRFITWHVDSVRAVTSVVQCLMFVDSHFHWSTTIHGVIYLARVILCTVKEKDKKRKNTQSSFRMFDFLEVFVGELGLKLWPLFKNLKLYINPTGFLHNFPHIYFEDCKPAFTVTKHLSQVILCLDKTVLIVERSKIFFLTRVVRRAPNEMLPLFYLGSHVHMIAHELL